MLTSPTRCSTFVPFNFFLMGHFLLVLSVHVLRRGGICSFWNWLFCRMLFWLLLTGVLTQSGRSFQLLPFRFPFRFFPLATSLVSQLACVRLLLFMLKLLLLLLLQLLLLSQLLLFGYPLLLNQPLRLLSFLKLLHLLLL